MVFMALAMLPRAGAVMPDGEEVTKEGMTALCRCGASANKPYCDGSHSKIEFDT